MSGVEALAWVLNPAAMERVRYQSDVIEEAERILADPGPLLAALAEAGVLRAEEEAQVHYRYGVNTGLLRAPNTPESIASVVQRHERATHGPVGVERIEVRTTFWHATEWKPAYG